MEDPDDVTFIAGLVVGYLVSDGKADTRWPELAILAAIREHAAIRGSELDDRIAPVFAAALSLSLLQGHIRADKEPADRPAEERTYRCSMRAFTESLEHDDVLRRHLMKDAIRRAEGPPSQPRTSEPPP